MKNEYDIAIIGGGIIGASIAYNLSQFELNVVLFEKNEVYGDETTHANSGVIHGGFDPEPYSLKAKLNVIGNKLWTEQIFPHLDFPRKKIASLVIAFDQNEHDHLVALYKRGLINHVDKNHLKMIDAKALFEIEPYLNPKAIGALVCDSSYLIDPFAATHAFLKVAYDNGVALHKNSKVNHIFYDKMSALFEIGLKNTNTKYYAKNIINCAGIYADEIANLCGYNDFEIKIRRGEYRILDRSQNAFVNSICFMVPTIYGKGVIVAPMIDGHVLVGPTAQENLDKSENRHVTIEKYYEIERIGNKLIPILDIKNKTIKTFAGSRAIDVATDDFVIGYAKQNNHFINVAGIQSPGISSAPAIALYVEKLLQKNNTQLVAKTNSKQNYKIFY